MRRSDAKGYIYFVGDHTDEAMKIGFSAKPASRVRDLGVGSPGQLKVYGTYKATRHEETMLHNRFRHLRIKGEWFKPGHDLIDFILDLKDAGELVPIEVHNENERVGT